MLNCEELCHLDFCGLLGLEKLRRRQRVKAEIVTPGCGGYIMWRGRAARMPNENIISSGGLSGKGSRLIEKGGTGDGSRITKDGSGLITVLGRRNYREKKNMAKKEKMAKS